MRSLLAIPLLLSLSCTTQTVKQCESYYFPMPSFLTGKEYIYVNQQDSSDTTTWKMKATVINKDTIFETGIYNAGKLTEKITEKVKDGLSKLIKYELFNNNRSSVAKIGDSLVYNCSQVPGELTGWSISYADPISSTRLLLRKLRSLKSTDGSTQVYEDDMQLSAAGEDRHYEYKVTFTYEKGKGLISYKITVPDKYVKEYRLAAIK